MEEPLDLLVSSVDYSWGGGGEITELTLVQPEVFEPQPESKKVKAVKAAKADPWKSVKKAVQG